MYKWWCGWWWMRVYMWRHSPSSSLPYSLSAHLNTSLCWWQSEYEICIRWLYDWAAESAPSRAESQFWITRVSSVCGLRLVHRPVCLSLFPIVLRALSTFHSRQGNARRGEPSRATFAVKPLDCGPKLYYGHYGQRIRAWIQMCQLVF